jgi:predicted nucleotidyltransferase component of viral defense system
MRDVLQQQIAGETSREAKLNRIREFLQILMLKIMFDHDCFQHVAFVGGTALRILFDLKRYSEDLDFSLIKKTGYRFSNILKSIKYELDKSGLETEFISREETNVHGGFIKFPGLLQQLGLSPLKSEKLSVKLEVDTNPPKGWHIAVKPVTQTMVFTVKHYDLPSLFATKLHACFFRKYVKGRDFYDLVWYLGKKIEPNMVLLNHAIEQTEHKNLHLDSENLRAFMQERLAGIDFKNVRADVERFLEDKRELKLIDKAGILQMLG